jgi:hypothetical protein
MEGLRTKRRLRIKLRRKKHSRPRKKRRRPIAKIVGLFKKLARRP